MFSQFYEFDWAWAWTRLKQILDMTEEEFYGEIEQANADGEDGGSHWSLEATESVVLMVEKRMKNTMEKRERRRRVRICLRTCRQKCGAK